jgi:hypothetical protein
MLGFDRLYRLIVSRRPPAGPQCPPRVSPSRRVLVTLVGGAVLGTMVATTSFGVGPFAAASGLTWSTVASPNQGTSTNYLNGVACPSSTFCEAVGVAAAPGLIETWNGTSWSIPPLPTPDGSPYLEGIACTAVSACTAVGFYINASSSQVPLIESWNGATWSISPSPSPSGAQDAVLLGVSCITSSYCTAVGHSFNGATDQTLVENWNGTAWSITPSPSPSSTGAVTLNSVSCTSTSFCVGAGYYVLSSSSEATLIETWDGTAWSITPSPNPSSTGTVQLLGVSCTSSTFCVAVGYDVASTGGSGALIETWDGTTWSLTSSPVPGVLAGVVCISPSNCTAVGDTSTQPVGGVPQTLIQNWDGSVWSVSASPDPGSNWNQLYGVACALPTLCAAVGYYSDGSSGSDERTLIQMGQTQTTATSTSLSSSVDPSRVNQKVTYTATVSPSAGGGSVAFTDNGSPIGGCSDVPLTGLAAVCSVAYSQTGSHVIVAKYSGDSNFSSSTSPPLGQAVMQCLFGTLGCNLVGADLINANLAGQIFVLTTMAGANMTGADLAGATLAFVDLSRVNFTGANLSGARLFFVAVSGATWANTTCPDGTKSDSDGQTCLGHLS